MHRKLQNTLRFYSFPNPTYVLFCTFEKLVFFLFFYDAVPFIQQENYIIMIKANHSFQWIFHMFQNTNKLKEKYPVLKFTLCKYIKYNTCTIKNRAETHKYFDHFFLSKTISLNIFFLYFRWYYYFRYFFKTPIFFKYFKHDMHILNMLLLLVLPSSVTK